MKARKKIIDRNFRKNLRKFMMIPLTKCLLFKN